MNGGSVVGVHEEHLWSRPMKSLFASFCITYSLCCQVTIFLSFSFSRCAPPLCVSLPPTTSDLHRRRLRLRLHRSARKRLLRKRRAPFNPRTTSLGTQLVTLSSARILYDFGSSKGIKKGKRKNGVTARAGRGARNYTL